MGLLNTLTLLKGLGSLLVRVPPQTTLRLPGADGSCLPLIFFHCWVRSC